MPADSPRIHDLRRRVQEDPASIAFAQLAEECRRAGDPAEAVAICRAGLAHYPDYMSARVTLGRALAALGQLDEARRELLAVVQQAPDNLAAQRGLDAITAAHRPVARAAPALFDLDELAGKLDGYAPRMPDNGSAAAMSGRGRLGSGAKGDRRDASASSRRPLPGMDAAEPIAASGDSFAALEASLRAFEARGPLDRSTLPVLPHPALAPLERWLAAIEAGRRGETAG